MDTDKDTAVVHDGVTLGGHPLAKEADLTKFVRHDTATQGLTAGQQSNVRANIGLSNVNNTSDADKPISTATQAALNQKLGLSGGSLSGPLNLAGNAANPLEAVPKQQLDASLANLTFSANAIVSGTISTARLGSGTANATTFLRGDNTWQTISTTPSTADVLNATAAAGAGGVGTYAVAMIKSGTSTNFGGTIAGSFLIPCESVASPGTALSGTALSGTWRCMARATQGSNSAGYWLLGPALWLRIS